MYWAHQTLIAHIQHGLGMSKSHSIHAFMHVCVYMIFPCIKGERSSGCSVHPCVSCFHADVCVLCVCLCMRHSAYIYIHIYRFIYISRIRDAWKHRKYIYLYTHDICMKYHTCILSNSFVCVCTCVYTQTEKADSAQATRVQAQSNIYVCTET